MGESVDFKSLGYVYFTWYETALCTDTSASFKCACISVRHSM